MHPVLTSEQINTLTRACVMAAPGHVLVWGDYSAVEARANAWMAGDTPALEGFRKNHDPYLALASRIYNTSITDKKDPRRKVGKIGELACGYGQGAGGPKNPRRGKGYGKPYGFYGFALKSGVDWAELERAKPPVTAQVVVTMWRELHAPIVQLWKALELGMLRAFAGHDNEVGVGCKVEWSRWNDAIVCTLPSGRALVYHDVQVGKGEYGPTLTYVGGKGREHTYGGKLCENVIQAICRDFLAEAEVKADAEGLDPVLTVHDELVCEVPEAVGERAKVRLFEIMTDLPPWGEGMPIGSSVFIGKRYRK